jgi:hypothetical protein
MLLWNRSESFDTKHFVGFSWNVRSDRTGQAEVSKPDTSAGASDQRVVFSQVRLSTVLEKRVPVWMYADCMPCQQICDWSNADWRLKSIECPPFMCHLSPGSSPTSSPLPPQMFSFVKHQQLRYLYRLFLDYIRLTGGVVCLVLPWKGRRKCSRKAGGGARQLWISWKVARRVEGFGSN